VILAPASEVERQPVSAGRPAASRALLDPVSLDQPPFHTQESPPATENHGTQVAFLSNPGDAARHAMQKQKLLFLLHVSGNFEEAKFT
jgi:hypothetical protein